MLPFDLNLLKDLVLEPLSCIKETRTSLRLALYPYHFNDLSSGIREILNDKLKKYDRSLEGILVGYSNVKILNDQGNIFSDYCQIYIDIEADFFIFAPEVGSKLKAIVNKTSPDHVGCLANNLFNISIPRPTHIDDRSQWIGNLVELSSDITCVVKQLDFSGSLPYIQAEILEESVEHTASVVEGSEDFDSGIGGFVSSEMEYTESEKKTKKKKRKRETAEDESAAHVQNDLSKTEVSPKKKKKSRKLYSAQQETWDVYSGDGEVVNVFPGESGENVGDTTGGDEMLNLNIRDAEQHDESRGKKKRKGKKSKDVSNEENPNLQSHEDSHEKEEDIEDRHERKKKKKHKDKRQSQVNQSSSGLVPAELGVDEDSEDNALEGQRSKGKTGSTFESVNLGEQRSTDFEATNVSPKEKRLKHSKNVHEVGDKAVRKLIESEESEHQDGALPGLGTFAGSSTSQRGVGGNKIKGGKKKKSGKDESSSVYSTEHVRGKEMKSKRDRGVSNEKPEEFEFVKQNIVEDALRKSLGYGVTDEAEKELKGKKGKKKKHMDKNSSEKIPELGDDAQKLLAETLKNLQSPSNDDDSITSEAMGGTQGKKKKHKNKKHSENVSESSTVENPTQQRSNDYYSEHKQSAFEERLRENAGSDETKKNHKAKKKKHSKNLDSEGSNDDETKMIRTNESHLKQKKKKIKQSEDVGSEKSPELNALKQKLLAETLKSLESPRNNDDVGTSEDLGGKQFKKKKHKDKTHSKVINEGQLSGVAQEVGVKQHSPKEKHSKSASNTVSDYVNLHSESVENSNIRKNNHKAKKMKHSEDLDIAGDKEETPVTAGTKHQVEQKSESEAASKHGFGKEDDEMKGAKKKKSKEKKSSDQPDVPHGSEQSSKKKKRKLKESRENYNSDDEYSQSAEGTREVHKQKKYSGVAVGSFVEEDGKRKLKEADQGGQSHQNLIENYLNFWNKKKVSPIDH